MSDTHKALAAHEIYTFVFDVFVCVSFAWFCVFLSLHRIRRGIVHSFVDIHHVSLANRTRSEYLNKKESVVLSDGTCTGEHDDRLAFWLSVPSISWNVMMTTTTTILYELARAKNHS